MPSARDWSRSPSPDGYMVSVMAGPVELQDLPDGEAPPDSVRWTYRHERRGRKRERRMSISSRYALITGGSRGIGRGIALKLAEQGTRLAIHYFQNEAAAQETLNSVRELGSDGFVVQADVTQPEAISADVSPGGRRVRRPGHLRQ